MKVLHVNNVASVGELLCVAQCKFLGYETHLINIIPKQMKFTRWEKLITLYNRIVLVVKARKFISNFKPNIVHIHYSTSALWMIGVKAKIVIHAHGSDIRLDKTDIARRLVNKVGLWRANILLYSTPDLSAYAEKYSIKSSYLPNPVDPDVYQCGMTLEGRKGGVKILLFAAPTRIKGFEISSLAISEIFKKYQNASVTMFKNDESIKFAKSNYVGKINLIEPVDQSEVVRLICQYDIVLGQFIIGSYGMSELQALSCGKPLICNAKNNSIVSASLPHLQAESSEEILREFERFMRLSRIDLERLAENSRRWIVENHGLLHVIKRLDVYYKQ